MIKTRTTFVLGAGASRPYGLPVARELHAEAQALKPQSPLYQLLLRSSVTAEQLNGFLDDLKQSRTTSIDAFLATRQNDADKMKVGRRVMAALMGAAIEKRKRDIPQDQDWLGYVFQKMLDGTCTFDEFTDGNSHVRFVTFNFDTTIEERLSEDIAATYPGGDISKALSSFPVIHIHGKLPPVPNRPIKESPINGYGREWTAWIDSAASGISVTLDAIDNSTLETAQLAVKGASVLCFLGFAYGVDNLKRLDLPKMLPTMHRAPEMFGSAFGLRPGEQERVRLLLHGKIKLGDGEKHCLDVLRDFYVFRE